MKHPTQARLKNSTAANRPQQITSNTARGPRFQPAKPSVVDQIVAAAASAAARNPAQDPGGITFTFGKCSRCGGEIFHRSDAPKSNQVCILCRRGAATLAGASMAASPESAQDPKGESPLSPHGRRFVGLFARRENTRVVVGLTGIAGCMLFNDSQLLDQLAMVIHEHRNLIVDHVLPKIENPFNTANFAQVLVIAEAITKECGWATDLDEVSGTSFDPSPLQLLAATGSYRPREGGAK